MVSTRQMATSGSGNINSNSSTGTGASTSSSAIYSASAASISSDSIVNPPLVLSTAPSSSFSYNNNPFCDATSSASPRLSVVTRQTLTNCDSCLTKPTNATPPAHQAVTISSANTNGFSSFPLTTSNSLASTSSLSASSCPSLSSSSDSLSTSSLSSLSSVIPSSSMATVAALEADHKLTFPSSVSLPDASSVYQSQSCLSKAVNSFGLLDMPIEILMKIFSYLDFKTIGLIRAVCHRLNEVGIEILNSTFTDLIKVTYSRFHEIKAMMPRRESARRNHPLACECDIIETCYMRLSLLQMTLGRHIERGHCCFFPGSILDEVYFIFKYIKTTPNLERPYRVTDELFDLSTMAMEYFREHIEPTLPGISNIFKAYFQTVTNNKKQASMAIPSDLTENSSNLSSSPPQSNMVLRKGIRKIKEGMKIYNNQLSVLRTELNTCKRKSTEQAKQIAEQQKLLGEQQKQALEYANRLDENDRKNEEMARKFSTLLQELNKCKTELQYWRSKSPAIPMCVSCSRKMAPVLPPEDFQALINQGVKPENILNLNDDTDAESDVSINEHNSLINQEFVFPDEKTTNKLLAVNTEVNKLKRQYSSISNSTTPATTILQPSPITIDNSTAVAPTTTTSSNSLRNSSNETNQLKTTTMQTLKSSAAITASTVNATITSENWKKQQANDDTTLPFYNCDDSAETLKDKTRLKESKGGFINDLINSGDSEESKNSLNLNKSYSTKLFYGNHLNRHQKYHQEQCHQSVIVSPSNGNGNGNCNSASTSAAADAAAKAEALRNVNKNVFSTSNGSASDIISNTVDVTSLQTISAQETKKARRVQKATRCLTHNSSKRSK